MRYKIALGLLAAAIPTTLVIAESVARRHHQGFHFSTPNFQLSGRHVGGTTAAQAAPAFLTGARIAAIDEDALVIDADSGKLIYEGANKAQKLDIGNNAGLLAYDPTAKLAYVADRQGDRIVVVTVGNELAIKKSFKTPVEPFGVALTPDRATLLVTTIADRALVAFDVATGAERWRTALGREPRGLAISPDGTRALISYLSTGTVDQVELAGREHRAEHIALTTGTVQGGGRFNGGEEGAAFSRASFAVTFMGSSTAVVPFQRETPVQVSDGRERAGSYGGGFEPPISHQVAFIGFGKSTPKQVSAQIAQHQPRAIAWDGTRDALYVAGLGSDSVLQIKNASQVSITEGLTRAMSGSDRCGPDGLAVTASGDVLVWCSFSRSVARIDYVDPAGAFGAEAKVVAGTTLVPTRLTTEQHAGMVVFHSADPAVSTRGAMACSSCHPDNRTDGLSWRIDKQTLQTPVLAGRMVGTHPYKWDGNDADLRTSLTMTMKRLGGGGLDKTKTDALQAYVESLPNVRPPTRDTTQVARGKALFDSAEVGCRTCHDGKTYSDNQKHKLTGSLPESDTPSLLGLAASAPYYHDGSAPNLETLLRERAAVHGMSDTSKLSDVQVRDLIAFLESL